MRSLNYNSLLYLADQRQKNADASLDLRFYSYFAEISNCILVQYGERLVFMISTAVNVRVYEGVFYMNSLVGEHRRTSLYSGGILFDCW